MSNNDIKHREFLEEKLHGQASCFPSLIFQFLQTNYLQFTYSHGNCPRTKLIVFKKIVTETFSHADLEAYRNYNP